MSGVLRWETPPPEDDVPSRAWAAAVAGELQQHPGEWAVVGEYEQPIDAASPLRSLCAQPHIWCTHVTDRQARRTTLYACWSRTKPERP